MKQKTLLTVLALSSLFAASIGCELVVDFDRTKLPQPASVTDAGMLPDVTQPPVVDSGMPDATTPAVDGGMDAGMDAAAVDDASTDAGSDSST